MEVKPGYKQTEVGVIPEEWGVSNLFDLAEHKKELFDDGDWIEAEFLTDKGIRLIQTGNIGEGYFANKDVKKYISEESFKQLRCKDLQVGDLLICRLAEPAGRACVLPNIGDDRVITVVDVTIFRPPESLADRRFLTNVFSTPRWFRAVNERCGGSTRTRISRSELGKIQVSIPPLPEQRAIAEALGDADGWTDSLENLLVKKRRLKQAAMQSLLTAQTRLPGFSGKWEIKQLGDLAEMGSGGTPPSSVEAYYDGDIPWVSISDMTKGGKIIRSTERNLTNHGFRNCSAQIFPNGTVLYAMYASLGECSIAGVSLCSSQAILGIRPGSQLNGEFLYYFLASMKSKVKTLGQQGTQANLNKRMVQEFNLLLPPLPEQTAIAEVLSGMDAEIEALEAKLAKARLIKQGMMQELLTGRIRLVHAA